MKEIRTGIVLFSIILLLTPLSAFADDFFYRAGNQSKGTRFEREWLTSFDASVAGGSSKKGRNSAKEKTEVFNIYGLHNMHQVARSVAGNPATNQYIAMADALWRLPGNGDFGKVKFTGKVAAIDAHLCLTQNFVNGFFGELDIPFYSLKSKDLAWTDQSPTDNTAPNANTAAWVQFKNNFDAILNAYGELSKADVSKSGVGDISLNFGWTTNQENMDTLDFFDATIRAGLVLPSAKDRDENSAFALSGGYDGHVGIPVSIDMSMGMYEWLTLGTHLGATFFTNKTKNMRMQTTEDQNGFIKLGKGNAKRDLGHIFKVGANLQADHVVKGLSVDFGYDFTSQSDTTLTPEDTNKFPSAAANADEMLKKWHRHALHLGVDYDFGGEDSKWNPHVGGFVNIPVAGKRIANVLTAGASSGVNVAWNF